MEIFRLGFVLLLLYLACSYFPTLLKAKLPPIVEGYFHPMFRKVAETIRDNVAQGKERGMAFAVYHRGNLLIDMWGGYADVDAHRPWSKDIMAIPYSTTKFVAAITIARMVEKGWLDYDEPVAKYWPRFAQKGKRYITVAQLLSHQAGLVFLKRKLSIFELRDDRNEVLRILEQAEPAWTPGTGHGYHGITFGLYVDALVEKADPKHRNMSQFFQDEIAVPYGIDFHIGVPNSQMYRMSRSHFASDFDNIVMSVSNLDNFKIFWNFLFKPDSITARSFNVLDLHNKNMNNPELLNIGLSSFIAAGTARSLAKLGDLAIGGRGRGRQLLSMSIVNKLTVPLTSGYDQVLMYNTSFGLGFTFKENSHPSFQNQMLTGHPGYGGSVAFVDPTNELSMAYITNHQSTYVKWDDPRYLDLEISFYECFDSYKKL